MPEAERMSEDRMALLQRMAELSASRDTAFPAAIGEAIRARASESRLLAELAEERGKREKMRASICAALEPFYGGGHIWSKPLEEAIRAQESQP